MSTTALPLRLWQAAVPLIAACVGVLAGFSPALGLAAAFGLVYVVLVFNDLALGVALFLGVTFLESISALESLSVAKLAGGILAFSWLALVATGRLEKRQLVTAHPTLVATLVALGAWVTVSVLWAELPGTALGGAQRWVLNLVLVPIVFTAVRERRHVYWMFALFIVGCLVSAAFGLTTGLSDGEDRLGGSGINANELGDLLIVSAVFAAALGSSRDLAPPLRALAFGASGLSVLALLATVSRGALVGMAFVMLVAPLVIGRGRRLLALSLAVLATAGGAVYLVALAPSTALDRITQADTQGSGRTEIWKVGLRMVKANPVLGVGADNYRNSTVHYLLEPGAVYRSDYIVDDPHVAHNIYLQVQAELGIFGTLAYLGILGFCLKSCLTAAGRFRAAGDRPMELMSRALLLGLCGMLSSAFFSNSIYNKQLWLLLALAVAIRSLAQRPAAAT